MIFGVISLQTCSNHIHCLLTYSFITRLFGANQLEGECYAISATIGFYNKKISTVVTLDFSADSALKKIVVVLQSRIHEKNNVFMIMGSQLNFCSRISKLRSFSKLEGDSPLYWWSQEIRFLRCSFLCNWSATQCYMGRWYCSSCFFPFLPLPQNNLLALTYNL